VGRLLLFLAGCALFLQPQFTRANIVVNGGFESGDFTGWILSGNPIPGNVDNSQPHSGQFAANLFAQDAPGFMEQFLATTPGASYTLSFFLASDGETPNSFSAQVDGKALLDQTNLAAFSYTQFSFTFVAASNSTDLKFGFRDDPGVLHLDDISVNAVPEPAAIYGLIAIALAAVIRQLTAGAVRNRPSGEAK
jgi:hypothetical protein